jgi:hypothetical protein
MSDDNSDLIQANALQTKQIAPLPLGSGGKNSVQQQFQQMNTKMGVMLAQANADKKFDPQPPEPVTKQVILRNGVKEGFCLHSAPVTLGAIGALVFVYGLVAK